MDVMCVYGQILQLPTKSLEKSLKFSSHNLQTALPFSLRYETALNHPPLEASHSTSSSIGKGIATSASSSGVKHLGCVANLYFPRTRGADAGTGGEWKLGGILQIRCMSKEVAKECEEM